MFYGGAQSFSAFIRFSVLRNKFLAFQTIIMHLASAFKGVFSSLQHRHIRFF